MVPSGFLLRSLVYLASILIIDIIGLLIGLLGFVDVCLSLGSFSAFCLSLTTHCLYSSRYLGFSNIKAIPSGVAFGDVASIQSVIAPTLSGDSQPPFLIIASSKLSLKLSAELPTKVSKFAK